MKWDGRSGQTQRNETTQFCRDLASRAVSMRTQAQPYTVTQKLDGWQVTLSLLCFGTVSSKHHKPADSRLLPGSWLYVCGCTVRESLRGRTKGSTGRRDHDEGPTRQSLGGTGRSRRSRIETALHRAKGEQSANEKAPNPRAVNVTAPFTPSIRRIPVPGPQPPHPRLDHSPSGCGLFPVRLTVHGMLSPCERDSRMKGRRGQSEERAQFLVSVGSKSWSSLATTISHSQTPKGRESSNQITQST
ncbi:hypothetical protein CCHR01_16155 [Colletotrichum chrysophilum]|uniref:Uncharacterized protein n=1 Tax=Colletotrichum chrysophilum TaxID=1836956 RepID=A0AAD9A4D6_9PEZI|nr:hypothetical protein CCHR01_16155 [Colletotrichum chrysophilum]